MRIIIPPGQPIQSFEVTSSVPHLPPARVLFGGFTPDRVEVGFQWQAKTITLAEAEAVARLVVAMMRASGQPI